MGKWIFLMTVLSATAFAGELHLSPGQSTLIRGNTDMTVYCAAGNDNSQNALCNSAGESFKLLISTCYRSDFGSHCAQRLWPKFKAANPRCVFAGTATCLSYCGKDEASLVCTELCS